MAVKGKKMIIDKKIILCTSEIKQNSYFHMSSAVRSLFLYEAEI
jgi:hypothetical protein